MVSTLPSPPIATAIPVTFATFAGANHWVFALMTAISPAETPTPMITRARTEAAQTVAQRERGEAGGGQQAERPLHAPRPEAVERDAVRQLRQRVGGEHARGEQPELAPGQRKLHRQHRADDRHDGTRGLIDQAERRKGQRDAQEEAPTGAHRLVPARHAIVRMRNIDSHAWVRTTHDER